MFSEVNMMGNLRAIVCVFLLLTFKVGLIDGQIESRQLQCSKKLADSKWTVTCSGYPAVPTDLGSSIDLPAVQVRILDLTGNHLQKVNEAEFSVVGLVNLGKIMLSNNQIRTIEQGAFNDLDMLVELDLSNNKIDSLDMEMFVRNDKLQILRLNRNPIHQLIGSKFPYLPALISLDLSYCQIKKIPKESFSNLPNLQTVVLSGNLFTRLDWDVFISVYQLTHLALTENPWYCDCHVKFLREYLLEKKIPTLDSQLTCTGPGALTNKSWSAVESNEYKCHPKISDLKIIGHDLDESTAFVDEGVVYSEIGKDIAFECVIESYPPPDVTWLKDKTIINETVARGFDNGEGNDSRITMQNRFVDQKSQYNYQYSNLLRIYKAEPSDLGSYSCSVKNSAGHEVKSVFLNFTNIPLAENDGAIVKTGGSKAWLWIVIALAILILIAAVILCFGIWKRREYKQQKVLKQQMMEKFKDSQTIIDDSDMQPKKAQQMSNGSDGAPLLPPPNNSKSQIQRLDSRQIPDVAKGNPEYLRSLSPEVFSPRPPSTADTKRQFFALRQMSEPPMSSSRPGSSMSTSNMHDPQGRRFQFAQQQHPASADRYYTIRRPGSSLSLAYPDPSYHPQQRPPFARQISGPAMPSYATMGYARERRPPSVSSFTSEAPQENYRPGFGYVTLPRGFVPPRVDSGFGRSLSPTESTYSSFSYSTLPRRGRTDPNTGLVYDAVGPRTSVDGGSNLSLNRIGESRSSNTLDSINQGLFSPTRGKVKSGRNRTGSSTTPGSIRGRNDFFSFEPIQEVDGSDDVLANKLPSNNHIDQLLSTIQSLPRTHESKFAKKKAPVIANMPQRTRKPIRTFEYSKLPEQQSHGQAALDNCPNPLTEVNEGTVGESAIDDPYEVKVDDFRIKAPPQLPPTPPPKPHRLQSSIENIFDLQIQPTIIEEVTGTEV